VTRFQGYKPSTHISKDYSVTFDELNLNEPLLQALNDLGFSEPTEIQEKAIPLLLKGHQDLVGQAQTGTGKTAAFVLPLLQRLNLNSNDMQALILAPTRELAKQIVEEIEKLSKYMKKVKTVCIYGGASYDKQIFEIQKKRPQVVVGTPGRVIDLMNKRVLDFSAAEFLILDEADEMLNMGFYDDVQRVLDSFNLNRMMWMFSATMPKEIKELIERECDLPEMVQVKKQTLSNADIEQLYFPVVKKQFAEAIYRLVISEKDAYGMVFCKTRGEAKDLAGNLADRGLKVECLNGDMAQQLREKAMERFKGRKVQLLICTDVAARGIDVNDLTHVFNYGLPQDIESYVHRIGRTGRAGKKGIAATIIDPRDLNGLRRIEHVTNQVIKKGELPCHDDLKSVIVAKDLEKMISIKEAVMDKKGEFKIDEAFKAFEEFFNETDKEDLAKILFTYMYNKELRRLDDIGKIPEGQDKGGFKRVRSSRQAGGRNAGGRRGGPQKGGRSGSSRGGSRDGGSRDGAPRGKKNFSGARKKTQKSSSASSWQ
jgi:ATP-dependent RNA helicase DeaD